MFQNCAKYLKISFYSQNPSIFSETLWLNLIQKWSYQINVELWIEFCVISNVEVRLNVDDYMVEFNSCVEFYTKLDLSVIKFWNQLTKIGPQSLRTQRGKNWDLMQKNLALSTNQIAGTKQISGPHARWGIFMWLQVDGAKHNFILNTKFGTW